MARKRHSSEEQTRTTVHIDKPSSVDKREPHSKIEPAPSKRVFKIGSLEPFAEAHRERERSWSE